MESFQKVNGNVPGNLSTHGVRTAPAGILKEGSDASAARLKVPGKISPLCESQDKLKVSPGK